MFQKPSIPESFNASDLDWMDRITLSLQSFYREQGYSRYRMGRFEPYDIYHENKGFLKDSTVITFTGPNGRLMALKPDITLSIVKDFSEASDCERYYYAENVFRVPMGGDEFSEIAQVGVECIGCETGESAADRDIEALMLAFSSLYLIGSSSRMVLSYMGLSEKSLLWLADSLKVAEPLPVAIKALTAIDDDEIAAEAASRLSVIADAFEEIGLLDCLFFDLSSMGDTDYYTGISFQGYVEGLPRAVLSGGRYDGLMERFGWKQGAIGFAIYLGEISHDFIEAQEG